MNNTRTERTSATRIYEDDGTIRNDRVVVHDNTSPLGMARNIVYAVIVAIESVLLIRFLFSLGGANRLNDFANFIYDLTAPLVAPFRGLFNVDTAIGNTARFEYEILIAMIVYGSIGMLLLTILRRPVDE